MKDHEVSARIRKEHEAQLRQYGHDGTEDSKREYDELMKRDAREMR